MFDLFWKLFNIAGGGTESDVTKVLDSIVKSDRSKLDQYFKNAIDQIAFDTQDWKRLRAFFIDLYSAHRSLITQSAGISDPHFLTNSELDELFRSFGYPESVSLKNFDDNPLENKVQLFLDLVNLYKIKGTPRSILEVLQYYGIPLLDIYEFWLQKEDANTLIFKGNVIVGTSINPSPVTLPYDLLTEGDPHWMMTESQVLNLNSINKINLPSKSPYFAVQPVVEIGVENAIFMREIQDQYDYWESTGLLPTQDAEITILGITSSLLELYLLALYSFQREYNVGTNVQRFACYDGTSTTAVEMIEEYEDIISSPIIRARYLSELTTNNRTAYNSTTPIPPISKLERYFDLFTRERESHFLYNKGDNAATTVLNLINPALIADIEALTPDNTVVLQSLMKDLALWVRNNVGFGFVNLGYIFFGLAQLFEDLKPVINFFKPYRARLIVLELLQFKNQLTESIPLNDHIKDYAIEQNVYDYITGDSNGCCNEDDLTIDIPYFPPDGDDIVFAFHDDYTPPSGWNVDFDYATTIVCSDDTTASTYYSRDTYDCGSYHDIGAVTDINSDIQIDIEHYLCDEIRCPSGCPSEDTAVSENQEICGDLRCGDTCVPYWLDGETRIISYLIPTPAEDYVPPDATSVDFIFCGDYPPPVGSDIDFVFEDALVCNIIEYEESAVIADLPYFQRWKFAPNLNEPIPPDSTSYYNTSIMVDSTAAIDCTSVVPLTCQTIPIVQSEVLTDTFERVENLTLGSQSVTVIFPEPYANSNYILNINLINHIDGYLGISLYGIVVTEKTPSQFTVLFSSPLDSVNYRLVWSVNPFATLTGSDNFILNDDTYRVNFGASIGSDNYAIATSISNQVDTNPSIYGFTIVEKDDTGFKLQLSGIIDSTNYVLDWNIYDSTSFIPWGYDNLPEGAEVVDIDIDPDEDDDQYVLSLSIVNTVDATTSIYSYMITKKNTNNFRIALSSPIDSTNYYLSWAITYRDLEVFTYRQESGFRLFDTMGKFDCTHGFDMVEISMDVIPSDGVILQENEEWLLQEDAVDEDNDDYGLILD